MATSVARVNPSSPIILIEAYEKVRTLALPQGAAEIALIACSPPVSTTGFPGRKGASALVAAIGPAPGPPPPWGIQNVLWRFKWQISAPISAGFVSPTCAFMLAPSM